MLITGKESGAADSKAKCYFSHTLLPHFIEDGQPPTKRKPFSRIYVRRFNHSLDLMVPEHVAGRVQKAVTAAVGEELRFVKVHMNLGDVLSGEFFNVYIKTGNILLLSEGRPGIDNTISLTDGILRIEMDKATYERAGLQGHAIPDYGRRHVKSRYLVEINLRLPSMVKGKKGFERILWAAANVFTHSLTWLFYDMRSPQAQDSGPIKDFQPFLRSAAAKVTRMNGVSVPNFPVELKDDEDSRVEAEELLEWLSLVSLDSPRVRAEDKIDAFLSRYSVPCQQDEELKKADLVKLNWHGFMPAVWVANIFMAAIKASGDEWFAMQVGGFEGKGLMMLKSNGKALAWECE